MTCGHNGHHLARQAAPECDLPACQRNEVYVFAISSLNPVSIVALDGLRDELNRQGFAKVATGQTIHTGWMAREMRRIRDAEPEAVFVVVGFESAGSSAVALAEKVAAEGLTVGGVVVIDSAGNFPASANGLRVVAVGNVAAAKASGAFEAVPVENVASFGLTTNEKTLEAVGQLLNDVGATVPIPIVEEAAEWEYPHAPPMRAFGDPTSAPEWSFLFDQQVRATKPKPTFVVLPSRQTVQPAGATLRSAIQ